MSRPSHLAHLRVAVLGGWWWFRAEDLSVLLDAIDDRAEWVALRDQAGIPTRIRVEEIVGFFVWTPELYETEKAFTMAVRTFCGEKPDDDILPGDEWKRGR